MDVLGEALLHGAAHVWIWRVKNDSVQILLQKRAANKLTWPNFYDISAAGHINLGEDPLTAAVRKTKEELGYDVSENDLKFIGVDKIFVKTADETLTENEIRWLYALQLDDSSNLVFTDGEVDSIVWKDIKDFTHEIEDTEQYVPHGATYYSMVLKAIARLSQ